MDILAPLNVGPHEEQGEANRTSEDRPRVSLRNHNAGAGKTGGAKGTYQPAMGATQSFV